MRSRQGVLVEHVFDELPAPGGAERQAILAAPVTPASWARAFDDLDILHGVEVLPPPEPQAAASPARILFWNAERLKEMDGSIALLSGRADVLMLCELDVGMARTGNVHTVATLARALRAGYVFGTEFVELGLGDLREQAWFAGQHNEAGLHGAGFVSRCPLSRPALVRVEESGRWFDGAFHERRVGGRMAVLATLHVGGRPVVLAVVHAESHSDSQERLDQTRVLLDAVDAYGPGLPVLIAGDFNTSTFTLPEKRDEAQVRAALAQDPDRLVAPQAYEPMFTLLRERGYGWESCNVPGQATQRTRPDGTPRPPFGKIDWLFARGLACIGAEVVPAVDGQGVAISDHEALAVTIQPA